MRGSVFSAAFAAAFLLSLGGRHLAAEEVIEDTVVADDVVAVDSDAPTSDVSSASSTVNSSSAGNSSSAYSNDAAPKTPGAKVRAVAVDPAIELADPRTYRLKVIMRVEAPDGAVRNVVAMSPIPMDWPEQRVRMISQKTSNGVRTSESVLKGQAAILKMQVPQIPKDGMAFVERLYEITRYRTKFTLPGDDLKSAKAVPTELREQWSGDAPGVEVKDPKMIELAETLRTSAEDAGPWQTAKSFWSWTRDNVKFENGDFRGALFAIEHRAGDCEEMSALFVGLCRLSGIAARTVWVESHDYPEFYALDKQGKGHWIPVQVVGPPWFGEITEYRPIFQKGDRFYDPLQKTYVRYVPHTVRVGDGKAAPKLVVDHQIIADSDINGPSYNSK